LLAAIVAENAPSAYSTPDEVALAVACFLTTARDLLSINSARIVSAPLPQ